MNVICNIIHTWLQYSEQSAVRIWKRIRQHTLTLGSKPKILARYVKNRKSYLTWVMNPQNNKLNDEGFTIYCWRYNGNDLHINYMIPREGTKPWCVFMQVLLKHINLQDSPTKKLEWWHRLVLVNRLELFLEGWWTNYHMQWCLSNRTMRNHNGGLPTWP